MYHKLLYCHRRCDFTNLDIQYYQAFQSLTQIALDFVEIVQRAAHKKGTRTLNNLMINLGLKCHMNHYGLGGYARNPYFCKNILII